MNTFKRSGVRAVQTSVSQDYGLDREAVGEVPQAICCKESATWNA